MEGGDVAIDDFTILIFIIITVIYRWVNNRLIYKFVKNDAQTKEKMFVTMFLYEKEIKMPNTVNLQHVPKLLVYLQNVFLHHTKRERLI